MAHSVIKIRSSWFVFEEGASHVIAQPYPTKARALVNAELRDKWAAEAIERAAELRTYRLIRAKAYLATRAARVPVAQLEMF
jgi:hypothetical protein